MVVLTLSSGPRGATDGGGATAGVTETTGAGAAVAGAPLSTTAPRSRAMSVVAERVAREPGRGADGRAGVGTAADGVVVAASTGAG